MGENPRISRARVISATFRGSPDGFDVSHFVPTLATAEDLTSAHRVVAIGVDLSAIAPVAVPRTSHWDDVPPASVDYAAARASIEKHIELLLDELAGKR